MDRDRLERWLAEVDALLKETDMPQFVEQDENGDDTLVDRPAPLQPNVINIPPTPDGDPPRVETQPHGEKIEDFEDTEAQPTAMDFEGETKVELQAELADRGLPTSGNKDELIARLEENG